MVDEFMVCIDHLIASACFESVDGGLVHNPATRAGVENFSVNSSLPSVNNNANDNGGEGCSKKAGMGDLVECRICQEEDEEHAMESPCACNGTLKFAHRRCIQRWCNKKGDTICEICNQVYTPNYCLPPTRANSNGMTIDIRQNLYPRIDLHYPHVLALTAAEHRFLRTEYEDYAVANPGGVACCRSVALILMLILLLRHALLVTRDSVPLQDALTFFNVSLLQLAGFLIPCYAMAQAMYIIQRRRRQ